MTLAQLIAAFLMKLGYSGNSGLFLVDRLETNAPTDGVRLGFNISDRNNIRALSTLLLLSTKDSSPFVATFSRTAAPTLSLKSGKTLEQVEQFLQDCEENILAEG